MDRVAWSNWPTRAVPWAGTVSPGRSVVIDFVAELWYTWFAAFWTICTHGVPEMAPKMLPKSKLRSWAFGSDGGHRPCNLEGFRFFRFFKVTSMALRLRGCTFWRIHPKLTMSMIQNNHVDWNARLWAFYLCRTFISSSSWMVLYKNHVDDLTAKLCTSWTRRGFLSRCTEPRQGDLLNIAKTWLRMA